MHPQQLKKKVSRPISSRVADRISTRSNSYLKTRIRGSRLQNAARLLLLVELTQRLHQAYAQAYDKQASDQLLPQNSNTPQTICHIMADVAQDEANDAISLNPNNPRAALKRFDKEFSRLYVGGPITSPFQAYRWRNGTGREIDGRYAANGSGFREEFRDTGTEPSGGRDADQTHHFVAYFSIGINDGSLTYLLADLREDNAGDKRLAEAAFNYGYELRLHPRKLRNVGNWIRNNICTGSQGHALYVSK